MYVVYIMVFILCYSDTEVDFLLNHLVINIKSQIKCDYTLMNSV